jgi:hypothetical protein
VVAFSLEPAHREPGRLPHASYFGLPFDAFTPATSWHGLRLLIESNE